MEVAQFVLSHRWLTYQIQQGDGNGCDHDRLAERRKDVTAESYFGESPMPAVHLFHS